ncbi:MAG: sigma 54-interacting transcriptional regulator [Chitinophagaceae bacterium]
MSRDRGNHTPKHLSFLTDPDTQKVNELLPAISRTLTSIRSMQQLASETFHLLQPVISLSNLFITCITPQTAIYPSHSHGNMAEFEKLLTTELSDENSFANTCLQSATPLLFHIDNQWMYQWPLIGLFRREGVQELLCMRLEYGSNITGLLILAANTTNTFTDGAASFIQLLSFQLSTVVENILINEKIEHQLQQINQYKQKLEEEKQYLQDEVSSGQTYKDIIGSGPEMQKVFHALSQVAFTQSTVLLLGETGTGKELVARAIHHSSPRKDKLMVKVNCAAMPAGLIESELFGHEKGSFTGAVERRIGKFELAHLGSLFLDEIGDMPFELQAKLLRAIQEKEFERIGGKNTIKVDVRIIAATNRNLQQEVDEGRFRSDLFYRLNVFPITLPPLRNRKEDIPALALHFAERLSGHAGKKKVRFSSGAIKALTAYEWPGNIRELEHLLERSALLAKTNVINATDLPLLHKKTTNHTKEEYTQTLEEVERAYIVGVLNKCKGKVYGPGGAATILGMNVSTLNSRIKKLGIRKEHIFSAKQS